MCSESMSVNVPEVIDFWLHIYSCSHHGGSAKYSLGNERNLFGEEQCVDIFALNPYT